MRRYTTRIIERIEPSNPIWFAVIGIVLSLVTIAVMALLGVITEALWGHWEWAIVTQVILAIEASLFGLQALAGDGEPWARRWDSSDPQAEFPQMGTKQTPRESNAWWLLTVLVIGAAWVLFGLYG